jgi:hypothetical protein
VAGIYRTKEIETMAAGERVIERRSTQSVVGAASPPRCRGRKVLPFAAGAPLLLALLFSFTAPLYAETRVALVSTCGGEAGQNVLALAEAKLSMGKDVALVERALVERVLDEQKLTRCGLSDSAQALAVGKLLGVQVFAAVETFPGSQEALGLVAFDAMSGVRLWDATLPAGGPEKTADGIVAAVREACEKRLRPTTVLRTVCLLSARNADLPRDLDSFCEAVGQILQRRLLGSASLSVLERERLQQINRERALPTATSSDDLWASLTLMDLELARAGTVGQTKATIVLSDTAGKQFDKLSITANKQDAASIAESLAEAVTKALQGAPVVAIVDRVSEANRFCEESDFLFAYDRERATQAAEAANALDPEHVVCIGKLAHCISLRAFDVLRACHTNDQKVKQENLNRALDLASRAMELDMGIYRRDLKNKGPGGVYLYLFNMFLDYFLAGLPNLDGCDSGTRARLELFRKQCRHAEMDLIDRTAWSSASDRAHYGPYVIHLRSFLGSVQYLSSDSGTWTTDTIDLLTRFLELMEKRGLCSVIDQEVSGMLLQTIQRATNRNLDRHDLDRFKVMFASWEHHTNEFIQIYGIAGQLAIDARVGGWGSLDVQNRYEAIKGLTRRALATSPCARADDFQVSVYQAALDAIGLLPDAAMKGREYQELFDLMIGRREFAYRLAIVASAPGQSPEARLKNVEAVLSLLGSPDCRYLGGRDPYWAMPQPDRGTIQNQFAILQRQLRPPTEMTVPWRAAHVLFRANENGFSHILRPQIQGDSVYVVGLGAEQGKGKVAQLLRIPMNGGPVERLGKVNCEWTPRDFDRGTSLADSRFCWATSNTGIFVFPVDGGQPVHLGKAEGLPSEEIHSLACMEGRLYAGCGEGILLSYDWQTREWTTIASKRRKESQSPLDNYSWPYRIRQMVSDPPRHRVLFTVDFGLGGCCGPLSGMWALDVRSGKLTRVLDLSYSCPWISPVRNGKLLIETRIDPGGASGIVQFDLASNRSQLLYVCRPSAQFGAHLQVDEGVGRISFNRYAPHLLVNGWLWSDDPFGRISADGKSVEFFDAVPRPPHAPDTDNLTGYLELIENGTKVLHLSDNNSLVILDLATNSLPNEAAAAGIKTKPSK